MATVSRRIELEKKWAGIIKDFQESRLSLAAYTRERQVHKASLYQWSKRLGIPLKAAPLSFIEVKSLAQPPKTDLFSVEVMVSKEGCKVQIPWPKAVEFVKAFLS